MLFVSFVVPIFPRPVDCVLSGERWTSPSTRSDVTTEANVRSRALVDVFVPDVFEPGNMAWSIAGLQSNLQQSFADR